ncbi:pentapeptide repeat-containing protein, partial [Streptomyces cahuitamycinicus]
MSTSEPPTWPHCAHGADPAADLVGCRGIHVPGHTACLAHLADADRDAYLAGLTPGASIDHRGTTFPESLLNALLNALRDPATGNARFGAAKFELATFEGNAGFGSATFGDNAWFGSAIFEGGAVFGSAIFEGGAVFGSAIFEGGAWFGSAIFEGNAWFGSATFERNAGFGSATFERNAWFGSATFKGDAVFESATFKDTAWFESATFKNDAGFGSAIFEGKAWFGSATFKGKAWFGSATFKDYAMFRSVTFEGGAWFGSVTFEGDAVFGSATFEGDAGFGSVTFEGDAGFGSVTFEGDAVFESATFGGNAWFGSATFKDYALFGSVTFEGDALFGSVTFEGDAVFGSATFVEADQFGPLVCAGRIVLSGAVFGGPVTLLFAARRLECRRTRWSSTAEIRLRYATVDFAQAVFEYPLTIAAEPDPFVLTDGRQLAEDPCPSAPDPGVRVASLRGVDAAHLVLSDLDLSGCLFAGTVHLDQLRLEGACTFDTAPPAVHWRRWPPVRFTARRVLAEEHHWRASQPGAVRGWA